MWQRIALHGLWLNALWEGVQCPILYDMGDMSGNARAAWMLAAIAADVLMVLAVAWGALRLAGQRRDFPANATAWSVLPLLGLLAGLLVEAIARSLGWWNYSPLMPTLALGDQTIGLFPLLQMLLLPALSVRLATSFKSTPKP